MLYPQNGDRIVTVDSLTDVTFPYVLDRACTQGWHGTEKENGEGRPIAVDRRGSAL